MNILIFNWRDPKNPQAGGAERLTQELAKRWIRKGHSVTQFSASFKNAKQKELIDGVQYIRKGHWWNVHLFACYYYFRYMRKQTDIIIDEVHWFPFFSAFYARKKTVALVCEVANKLFFTIYPFPIAIFWRLIEKIYLTVYKNVPTMAISQSTYEDLIVEGHKSSNLIVLPMGLTVSITLKQSEKEKEPTLIYVARLNKQKGIFDTIEAFRIAKEQIPGLKLWIVGSGDVAIVRKVKNALKKQKLEDFVKLFGFVTEEKKFALLSRAHLLISASVQEGWGLTVPEAGLTKTPAIVYNTHGFRDIIVNKEDGLLVDPIPSALAKGIVAILQDKKLYKRLQIAAEKKAKSYSWDTTADSAMKFMQSL